MVKKQACALDTSIAIELLRGNPKVISEISKYQVIYLPITVCGELLFGAYNSKEKKQNVEKVSSFIDDCIVLNPNKLVAIEYAEVRKKLATKGTPIPENDIWIAAICIVYDISFITMDKHFKLVDDIKLIQLK